MAIIKVLKDKLGNILDPFIPRYEALRVYSTEPVVIGKWIDNRPIYRKMIYIENTDKFKPSDYYIESGVTNVGYLDLRGGMTSRQSNSWLPLTQNLGGTLYSRLGMSDKAKGTIVINIGDYFNSSSTRRDLTITMEYTVTTDDPIE